MHGSQVKITNGAKALSLGSTLTPTEERLYKHIEQVECVVLSCHLDNACESKQRGYPPVFGHLRYSLSTSSKGIASQGFQPCRWYRGEINEAWPNFQSSDLK